MAWERLAATQAMVWGSTDCVLSVADAVLAFTGTDLAARFRGRYSTRRGAFGIVTRAGGLLALVDATLERAELGYRLPSWRQAQRGDVAVYEETGDAGLELRLGICTGPGQLALRAEQGLAYRRMSLATHAWAIAR